MIQAGPMPLLLTANVQSTIIEREQKAKIISPIHTSVVIKPDLYMTTTVNEPVVEKELTVAPVITLVVDESKPYRVGYTHTFKDKVPSISTSRMRIEYRYLEERLSSKYERMVTEGIECLHKIGYDLRYYYSSIQEMIRGLDDERSMVREACIKGLKNLGTRRIEKAVNAQVEKTIAFLTKEGADTYKKSISDMWQEIDKNNDRRLSMLRVYEANTQINILASNVPHLFVFHVDYRTSRVSTKTSVVEVAIVAQ